jgi:hypothetical protein
MNTRQVGRSGSNAIPMDRLLIGSFRAFQKFEKYKVAFEFVFRTNRLIFTSAETSSQYF